MAEHFPDPALSTLSPEDLLLVLLYGECRGAGRSAQEAVGCSVRNRVSSPHWFGAPDYPGVILRWAQYDALWPQLGASNYVTTLAFAKRLVRTGYVLSPNEQLLRAVAQSVLDGSLVDPTGGATFYYDDSIKPPNWAVPPAEESLVLGHLHFWRNVA